MTRLGQKRYEGWLRFIREAGWHPSTWKRLADLWLEHHDDDGAIRGTGAK